jgi:hypothetical protein
LRLFKAVERPEKAARFERRIPRFGHLGENRPTLAQGVGFLGMAPSGSSSSRPAAYFLNRFSNAWRASKGFDVEVSRSTMVRGA